MHENGNVFVREEPENGRCSEHTLDILEIYNENLIDLQPAPTASNTVA